MRAVTIVAIVAFQTAAMPANANGVDFSLWSLEDLCEKKDKPRHTEAIFAELGRRDVFNAADLELVRSGRIDLGMGEAALQCVWGAPQSVSQGNGDTWQTFRNPVDGQKRTVDVHVVAGSVTDVRIRPDASQQSSLSAVNQSRPSANAFLSVSSLTSLSDWRTFSGRQIWATGVEPFPCDCEYPVRP